MIDRDRPGCPSCRQKLVRRLRGEPFPDIGAGPSLPVRHYGTEYLAIAAIVAAVAGTAISAYGQYQAGQQQQAAYEYNAILAAQQGAYQNQLGQFQASMLERQMMGVTALAEAEAAFGVQSAQAQEAAGTAAALAAGRVHEAAIVRAYDRTQSEVRAAIGKSGVDTTGSPLLVLMENADTVGQEIALNDYQTALDVAGAKVGTYGAKGEAALSKMGAGLRAGSLGQEAAFARYGGAAALAGSAGQASMLRIQGQGASRAAMFNTGRTLLGGLGDAGNVYLRYGATRDVASAGYR